MAKKIAKKAKAKAVASKVTVKAKLVNCEPWSVLKISGRP